MRTSKMLALLGMTVMSLYLFALSGAAGQLQERAAARIDQGRMKNVTVETPQPVPEEPAAPAGPGLLTAQPAAEAAPSAAERRESAADEILETTIRGGLAIKNETACTVDLQELLRQGPGLRLPAEGPQILILHTHGSEAYTPAGLDRYEASDNRRTEDARFSVIRVGDELAAIFEQAGLRVLHDREIYDYPSYTGSYTRSGEAVERCLAENPGIAVVIDLHRDALGSDGVVYKTMAEEDGTVASQIMLLVGTDESGLAHPGWRSNLALALYLQERVSLVHPTLLRPVELVPQRYNQHLCGGSLILEVGSSGNTLQEALAAIRLFGTAAAPALAELTEEPREDLDKP